MQLSLDPAQQLAGLTFTIHRSIEDASGELGVILTNDMGKVLGVDRIKWRKPHDLSGLPILAREVADVFMWGGPADVLMQLRVSFKRHVHALDIDAQGELRRLASPELRKRRRKG